MENKRSGRLKSRAARAALSMTVLMALAAPASAEKALTGLWSGEDDLAINFDERWADLGPDTGCKISSLKSTGSNRWRMRLSCGVADTDGGFKADTTLQLKGSTLFLTTKDGTNQLQRQ